MPALLGDPPSTLRRDPSSTRLVHYGRIFHGGTWRDERVWAPLCRGGSGIDTGFWSIAIEPEGPTCLWCIAKEFA